MASDLRSLQAVGARPGVAWLLDNFKANVEAISMSHL